MKKYIILVLAFVLSACSSHQNKLNVDLSKIKIEPVKIKRYERVLFNIDQRNLKEQLTNIKQEYGFFLSGDIEDEAYLKQIQDYLSDPLLKELYKECSEKYKNVDDIENQLTEAFRYYKFYFPNEKAPNVYTYISGMDYQFPIKYVDTVIVIALDMYLGGDNKLYNQIGLPQYKARKAIKEYIIPDCIKEMSYKHIPFDEAEKPLLDQMIYHGKILYFMDAMLPSLSDETKIEYTSQQQSWCKKNETAIWAYFIENNLLYSTDKTIVNKLITDGPFTSYFTNESPARMGEWIGWQIVRAYMKRNDVSLQDLFKNNNAQEILTKSKYKPKK